MLVLLLFFCSGATALVYEVVWSKYLALMFGSTIQAQTIVLATFMGGLALGNHVFGKRADLLRHPLPAYGYIELAIGLYAFFFQQIYAGADDIFVRVGTAWFTHPTLLLLLKGTLSSGLLILPTFLMGGTLPLLAAWLQKRFDDAGRRSARFYSTNSLGAVFGAGLAGFWLVRNWGMVSSLQLAACANFFIGIAAIYVGRQEELMTLAPTAGPEPAIAAPSAAARRRLFMAMLTVAFTGASSMGLEVLASRCLALIFGGSLQSFAIVLMAFILGIGIGSGVIASAKTQLVRQERMIIGLLLGASMLIGLFVINIEGWTVLYGKARSGLAATPVGYDYHELLLGLISISTIGLPAAMIGAVLPLWIRLLSEDHASLASQVGKLLTVNTLGGVVGVLVTGFVLMPGIGLRASIAAIAIGLAGFAVAGAWLAKNSAGILTGLVLMFGLVWTAIQGDDGWRHVLGSGIFRLRTPDITSAVFDQRRKLIKILYYEDAPDATVSVETGVKKLEKEEIVLRINGKPDASSQGDLSTQYLLGHLPIMARPQSKNVFILGFGSGITAGAVLGHPVEKVTVAENCRPILRAAKFFEPWNRGALTNSRTRICNDDARTVLKLSPDIYDVIISEPSNPWVAGIGSVFSSEFYELCASRLADGGVMAQWFHIYEMHDGIVNLVLRTFQSVFPFLEIWDSESGDIILLGSKKSWKSDPEVYAQLFARPQPRDDMGRIGIATPEAVWARQIASQRSSFAIAGEGPLQSDEFPVLEYEAPRAFFIGKSAVDIFIFDERVAQSFLAPPLKRATLGNLSDALLHPIFATYSSSNPTLLEYLKWRGSTPANQSSNSVYPTGPFIPFIFRSTNSYPEAPEVTAQASPEMINLSQAQILIYRKPQFWRPATAEIDRILQANMGKTAEERDWAAHYFASEGAKAKFSFGDVTGALATAEFGLKYSPNDPQLLYLKRLFEQYARVK